MASRAENLLQQAHLKAQVTPLRERGFSTGAGIFLTAEYEHTRAGFSALGKIGLAAEQVAQMAVDEFLDFHHSGSVVDRFLGDQLLLPMALSSGISQYQVAEISPHLMTNAWVIEQFGLAQIDIDPQTQIVSVSPKD
jgi:RNA 3'-terminal phosphate cyclase (ATP)